MIKMPPPGHPLRDTLDPQQVAAYCNPAFYPLAENVEETTELAMAYFKAERAAVSIDALCTDANGDNLLVRVFRDGSNRRLWNFCTGADYGYFNTEETLPDFGEYDAVSDV